MTTKLLAILLPAVFLAGVTACQNEPGRVEPATTMTSETEVVEVTAIGLTFEAPDSIPSGWTTFRFTNTGDVTHFAVIERLPEGIGIAEHQADAAPVFQRGMDWLNAGMPDSAFAEFGRLPSWFGEIVFMGGPGLTGPEQSSQTTVYLEPGRYLFECYAKTDGTFHSYNENPGKYGMVHEFVVTSEVSKKSEPTADVNITLSSEHGIEVDSTIAPGEHTVAVHFENQTIHENFVGHDVHLARLEDDTNLDTLATWMDWSQPIGLQAPDPARFIGGAQEMPAGSTEYFTVILEPGRYVWISEVTNPAEKGMLKTFVVEADPT